MGMNNFNYLQIEISGAAAWITLNRPEIHNAFDETLIAEITTAVLELSTKGDIRAIVFKGAGKSFCAGADLEYMGRMAQYSRQQNLEDASKLQKMFQTITDSPKVTIARVHGAALGGGAGLVAACDIAVSSHDATFGFTEVRLGLAPAVIAPFVVRKLGPSVAKSLFITGERISADFALRIGLIHQVESFNQDAAIHKRIKDISETGPHAVAAVKLLVNAITTQTDDEIQKATVSCIADLRVSEEGQEGISAFLNKRKPNWVPNE